MATTVVDAMKTVLDGGTVPQYILTPSVVVDASNIQDYVGGKLWTAPIAGSPELDNGKPLVNSPSSQAANLGS
jgi:ribose transport system substrate-binding protein